MPIVVDASAYVGIVLGEDAAYSTLLARTIVAEGAVVPSLFWFELCNAMITNERRKRITQTQSLKFLADSRLLPIETDAELNLEQVMNLARDHTLTVYDATYPALAQRRNCAMATQDKALIAAAKSSGLSLLSL